jgi:TolB-like protein/Tfp pilus assembly protein PilF
MLLEHPGELVTREEIGKKLWSADTFVDFDHGLNNAVNRLREALGDSADTPGLIETLPRRGYRFIAKITNQKLTQVESVEPTSPEPETLAAAGINQGSRRKIYRLVAVAVILAIASLAALKFGKRGKDPSETIRSLAVLPLENLSGDPKQDYFADGMTDALITDLANVSSLRVISRTTAMRYKGSQRSLREIARELQVDAVVEGTVVRAGNRVRVTAQLIQAPTDRHLWAKAYDRDMSEVLTVQRQIAQSIVREIQAKLTPTEESKLQAKPQDINPEAYLAYLEGRSCLERRSLQGYNQGLALFQRAIEVSPTYAPAYAGLAESYNLLALGMGTISPIEAAERAKTAVHKALELDPDLAEAHAALGFTLHRYEWNWTGAEEEYRRAVELEPRNGIFNIGYSGLLTMLGRSDEAQAYRNQGRDVDPRTVQGVRAVAGAYLEKGQTEKATEYYKKAIESQPDSFRLRMDMATGYRESGHYAEAQEEFQKVIALYGPNVFPEAELGYTYALWGKQAEAERILEDLKKQRRPGYLSYAVAQICATLGRKQEALFWLQKAYEEHATQMIGAEGDSAFASLRSEKRFQDVVHRVGLPVVASR